MRMNAGMTLIEHLGEFRKRIIWILVVLVLGIIIGLVSAPYLILMLKNVPPVSEIDWNVFSPWDAIRIYMNVAFVVGILLSLPFSLFQIWLFVKPGLHPDERKASLTYIPGVIIMFLIGLAFSCFVVLPMALLFTSSVVNTLGLVETYGIAQYFSFMFNIIIPVSLMFELPVVVMFLTRVHILTPRLLKKIRRYAYFLLVVISTLITPPDLVSAVIVAVPLILLFEASIYMSGIVYRRAAVNNYSDREDEAESVVPVSSN